MGRVDPGTARVTAVTPLEELDTAVTTLAVGLGRVGRHASGWMRTQPEGRLSQPEAPQVMTSRCLTSAENGQLKLAQSASSGPG
jgi:hypothetical protein